MLEIVLSPRALEFLAALPWATRKLLAWELNLLGTPARFLELRDVLGRPPWLEGKIEPFVVQCRVLSAGEAATYGIQGRALYVIDIHRADRLRAAGTRMIRQAEKG